MKYIACWITDWIGWFFIELAVLLFGDREEGMLVQIAEYVFDAGNWSYGLFE